MKNTVNSNSNRIVLAIELIEEASHAVSAIPSTLLFPLAPFCWEVLVREKNFPQKIL